MKMMMLKDLKRPVALCKPNHVLRNTGALVDLPVARKHRLVSHLWGLVCKRQTLWTCASVKLSKKPWIQSELGYGEREMLEDLIRCCSHPVTRKRCTRSFPNAMLL
jgi:hypothetical protein